MIDAPLSKRWHKFSAGLCKLLLDCYCVDPSRRLSGWSDIRKHIVHKLKFFSLLCDATIIFARLSGDSGMTFGG